MRLGSPAGQRGRRYRRYCWAHRMRPIALGVTAPFCRRGCDRHEWAGWYGECEGHSLAEYPQKGRATAVWCIVSDGRIELALAWVGIEPQRLAPGGVARSPPTEHGSRDGSGVPLTQAIGAVGPNYVAITEASKMASDGKSCSSLFLVGSLLFSSVVRGSSVAFMQRRQHCYLLM